MMKRKFLFLILLCFINLAYASDWGYGKENGPNSWASLNPKYAPCKLNELQSPIDISTQHTTPTINQLTILYKNNAKDIINNGHSVQVNFNDAGGITFEDTHYSLVQLHFHTPSETKINHKSFPMEMHLLHKDKQNHLLVLSVLFKEKKENLALKNIVQNIPNNINEPKALTELNVADLLPKKQGYYAFSGSLTTPPCTDNVQWIVLKTPLEASKKQIMSLHKAFGNNARDTQPLHERVIKEAP